MMKTKNIFKTLAFAMLMPAILLTTACGNINNNEDTDKKGYTLPVTVNVTRQGGEATTKATYTDNGDGTGQLSFSSGDKLFVYGDHTTATGFYGTLNMDSPGVFSGTITTEDPYSGTAQELLESANYASATLMPFNYDTYNFLYFTGPYLDQNYAKAFTTSKVTAIEQFSYEYTDTYSSGFELGPLNAILNFTITGLTPSTEYAVIVSDGTERSGIVTTNTSGNAEFAIGVVGGIYSEYLTLTVGGNAVALNLDGVNNIPLEAGKIYNVTRSAAPAAAKAAAEATAEDKGKLIGTDGKIYDDVTAATAAGTTAVAKIIYIGTTGHATYSHGLALALTDEASTAWQAAINACSAKNSDTPVTDATWLLASKDQWNYMLGTNGAGSKNALRDGFSGITGASNLQKLFYWSSTESAASNAWRYDFGGSNGWRSNGIKTDPLLVRACLAF